MDDECESVTEAKSLTAKKKIDVLGAMAKYKLKKEQEKEQITKSCPTVSQNDAGKTTDHKNTGGRRGKKNKWSQHNQRNPWRGKQGNSLEANQGNVCQSNKGENVVDPTEQSSLGITEYVNKGDGFSAILKQRYSDFQVNEIDMNGKVVHLTDQSLPAEVVESVSAVQNDVLTAEQWSSIEEMMNCEDKKIVKIDVTDKNKEERSTIHKVLRAKYKDLASNSAPTTDGKTIMEIFKHAAGNKEKRWKGPSYVQFVMYKENLSTMEAISNISRKLRLKSSLFQTAGTKDKRGITCQLVTVKKVDPRKILNSVSHDRKIAVGNFTFTETPLELGHLKGNRFRIVLRNVVGDEKEIIDNLDSLKEKGFINYYGAQRFGTRHVPTHHIGKQLLLGHWKEAIDLILEPPESNGEFHRDYDLVLARIEWKTSRNADRAYSKVNRSMHTVEGQLLFHLRKFGTDLVGALNTIPRNMRLTYIHAYQSFLWNTCVSKRLATFGMKPIIGDLVYEDDKEEIKMELEDELEIEATEDEEEGSNRRAQRNRRKVLLIDESNIHKYTIDDVLLPLPGHDITYPANEVAGWYLELMKADGLSESDFQQRVKSYNLGGAYRLAISKPVDVEWKFIRYDDPTVSQIPSDLDLMKNVQLPPLAVKDGAYLGLILEFSLPPSAYATMALREITKMDMSAKFQTSLNKAGTGRPAQSQQPEEEEEGERLTKQEPGDATRSHDQEEPESKRIKQELVDTSYNEGRMGGEEPELASKHISKPDD